MPSNVIEKRERIRMRIPSGLSGCEPIDRSSERRYCPSFGISYNSLMSLVRLISEPDLS